MNAVIDILVQQRASVKRCWKSEAVCEVSDEPV
jgi:hypothetical protein